MFLYFSTKKTKAMDAFAMSLVRCNVETHDLQLRTYSTLECRAFGDSALSRQELWPRMYESTHVNLGFSSIGRRKNPFVTRTPTNMHLHEAAT